MKITASLWVNGNPHSYHLISLPKFGEPGHYTQGVSLSAFHQREARKLHQANLKGVSDLPRRCSVRWGEDDASQKWLMENMKREVFKHASVWDFYKAVGYDYKKQRYTITKE